MIKQVPKAVNTRIRKLSSNKKIFHESSKMYIEALKNCGFKEEFTYLEPKKINNNNDNNKIWQPKKHNEKAEWINNMTKELEGLQEGTKAEIHIHLLKSTYQTGKR